MNLISLSSFSKARIILRINALFLFLFIVVTPYLVKTGVWGIAEATVEGVFLALEIIILIKLFRDYDLYSSKSEYRASKLKGKLKEQQRLVADSLEYLGKINVQMSIVKQISEKLKTPVDKNRLEYVMHDILQTAMGLINAKGVVLKIVDLKNKQTIKKFALQEKGDFKRDIKKISNKELCNTKQAVDMGDLYIVSSEYDNFSLKTFAFFDLGKNSTEIQKEQFELVRDVINQCEIIFALANSKYYKNKIK